MMCIAEAPRHNQIRECCQAYWPPSGPTSQISRSACHTRSRAQRTQCKDLMCPMRRNRARSCPSPLTSQHQALFQLLDPSRATLLLPDHPLKKASNRSPRPSPSERQKGTWLRHAYHARKPISGKLRFAFHSKTETCTNPHQMRRYVKNLLSPPCGPPCGAPFFCVCLGERVLSPEATMPKQFGLSRVLDQTLHLHYFYINWSSSYCDQPALAVVWEAAAVAIPKHPRRGYNARRNALEMV